MTRRVVPVPRVVRIGGKRFRLQPVVSEDEGVARGMHYSCLGSTLFDRGLIRFRVAGNEVSPDEEADTVLHEVLHACWHAAGLKDTKRYDEERVAARLAPVLLDSLRRSPELVAYLVTEGVMPDGKEKAKA